ncbi:protein toll-like [Liolophura sinensis]|uniref:protein toll-like n=1 Tax=Liolophura sinensis TaxID=3198878 RepID=UPI00315902DA
MLRCVIRLYVTCGLLWTQSMYSAYAKGCSVKTHTIIGPSSIDNYEIHGLAIDTMFVRYVVTGQGEITGNKACLLDTSEFYRDELTARLRQKTYVIVFLECSTRLTLDLSSPKTASPSLIIFGRLSVGNCIIGSHLAESLMSMFSLYGLFLLDSSLYISHYPSDSSEVSLLGTIGELTLRQENSSLTLNDLPMAAVRYDSVVKLGLVGLNSLVTLPDGIEKKFPRLQVLSLFNNSLVRLPHIGWSNVTVDLPHNIHRTDNMKASEEYIWQLDTPLNGIPRVLDLTSNKLETLETDWFSHELDMLNLGENRISQIPVGIFGSLHNLQSLDLHGNHIEGLNSSTFAGLSSLKYLYLYDNSIAFIEEEAFQGLVSLRILDVSRNKLSAKQSSYLTGLINLRMLILSENSITTFVEDFFLSVPLLSIVNLSSNPLMEFPPSSLALTHLREIDLGYTGLGFDAFINALGSVSASGLTNRVVNGIIISIVLRGNTIMSAYNLTLENIWQLPKSLGMKFLLGLNSSCIDVEENPLICDCRVASLVSFLKLTENTLASPDSGVYTYSWNVCWKGWICATPAEFSGRDMFDLDPSRLYCPSEEGGCPGTCDCYDRYDNAGKVVICENKDLTQLPKKQPRGLLDLRLAGNKLSTIENREYLGRVERLDLSNNSLAVLPRDALARLTNLTHLHITSNRLIEFPEPLTTLKLNEITMGNNPFRCTCENIWFKRWLIENKNKVLDWDTISCSVGNKVVRVLDVTEDLLRCSFVTNIAIAVSLGLVLLCLVLAVVAMVHFRHEIKVLWFIYQANNNNDAEMVDKDYNTFIVFARNDREWTEENVISTLYVYFPNCSLCTRFDDFIPGQSMKENLYRTLRSSASVTIVLSNAFLNDEWCRFTLREALAMVVDKKLNFVNIINLDGFKADVYEEVLLNKYIRLKRYLNPKSRLFPQRLVYAVFGKKQVYPERFDLMEFDPNSTNPDLPPDDHMFETRDLNIRDNSVVTRRFQYDVGLLYGDAERQWVVQVLLHTLEREGITVCLPDRDPLYAPGAADSDNVIALISNCRSVILVVSTEFLRTQRCRFCFRAATGKLTGRKGEQRFLLLLTDDMDICEVKEVNSYMRTHVCLGKNEANFTQRLMRALY